MAYQVIWAPCARLDLKELASYIAEARPRASTRFIKRVFQMVEYLADFPESGRVVPEFNDPAIREGNPRAVAALSNGVRNTVTQ